jgi:fatty-acyl-CoA synthase
VTALPVTGTNKIDKAPLRRDRWTSTGNDAVYWRPEPRDPYRRLTEDDRREILRRFTANSRGHVLQR